jgi:hypothetical protein
MSRSYNLHVAHVFFALFIVTALAAFVIFDIIVRAEYTRYRSEWESDGRPHGFFWVPPEVRGWLNGPTTRSSFARARCSLWWSVKTPPWARDDHDVRRAFHGYRSCICANAMLFIAFAMSILHRPA